MKKKTVNQNKKSSHGNLLGTIAKQSQWVFVGKITFTLLGVCISILLARILGPSALGKYQLCLTVIQVATIFSVAGFDGGLIRFLPILSMEQSSEARDLFIFNIQISLTLSIALAIALYFSAPLLSTHYFHSEEMTEGLRVFCLYLPVFTVFRIAGGAVIGLKRADVQSNITNVVSPVLFLILLLLIYFFDGAVVSCILMRSITHLIGAGLLIFFLLKTLPRFAHVPERSVSLRRFFSYSTPLMLIGLIYFLLGQMDILMLGYFMPESEVGIYSVALKIAMFVIFGLEIMLPIVRPHFSELSERKDFEAIGVIFKAVTKWLLYSGLFVFCLIAILRFEVLNIFGAEFVVGGNILLILGIGHLANVISGPTGQLLMMTGGEKWEIANSLMIIVLNFFLNLFLIPKMGTIGAAIATALSISLINFAKLIQVYLIYNIHPYSPKLLKGISAIIFGGMACYFVRIAAIGEKLGIMLTIMLAGLSFVTVTFGSIWFLGFDEEDKVLFKSLWRR